MRMYITSARRHELSGRVCAHAYNYMPGLALQQPLSKTIGYVYLLIFIYGKTIDYCKYGAFVTSTLGLHTMHSSYNFGEPTFIPQLLLPCVYDIYCSFITD